MNTFFSAAQQFVNDEDGITAIEYGLIAAFIATAIVLGFKPLSVLVEGAFTKIGTNLTGP
ncbi:pilus assembly protein Flp/PilA [Oxalobacteraceae bacterium GrIS 1.11]